MKLQEPKHSPNHNPERSWTECTTLEQLIFLPVIRNEPEILSKKGKVEKRKNKQEAG